MIVGTVREIKNEEFRVGLTPEGAHALANAGQAANFVVRRRHQPKAGVR